MKSITIHNLDDPLDSLIREKAKIQGLSLNKTIKKLLEQSLGIKPHAEEKGKKDFSDLFGCWSEGERKEFEKRIKPFSKIDKKEWE